jgi:hypothetical protein
VYSFGSLEVSVVYVFLDDLRNHINESIIPLIGLDKMRSRIKDGTFNSINFKM